MIARLSVALCLVASCVVHEQVGSLAGDGDGVDAAPPTDTGVALACTEPLPCFAPLEDRVTVCGQLYDIETGEPLWPLSGQRALRLELRRSWMSRARPPVS